MQATHRPDGLKELGPDGQWRYVPGAFRFLTRDDGGQAMRLVCPGWCNAALTLSIRLPGGTGEGWEWNGSTELPTLSPSLNHVGCWHGHLVAGVLTEC